MPFFYIILLVLCLHYSNILIDVTPAGNNILLDGTLAGNNTPFLGRILIEYEGENLDCGRIRLVNCIGSYFDTVYVEHLEMLNKRNSPLEETKLLEEIKLPPYCVKLIRNFEELSEEEFEVEYEGLSSSISCSLSFSGSDDSDDDVDGDDSDNDEIARLIFPEKRELVKEPENTENYLLTGQIYYKRIPKKNSLIMEKWKIGKYGSWKYSVGYFMTLKSIPSVKGFHRADRFINKYLSKDSGYTSQDY